MSCITLKKNAINLSETGAEATKEKSVVLSDERLRLFGHDGALDAFYTFLDYCPCSDESDGVEGSIAQSVRHDA